MAGRGFGKTRTGAEFVKHCIDSKGYRRIALVARTKADARDVMVEGESGLLSIYPSWNQPLYEPSKRRVTFPNGAIATTYSGDEPAQLRGPQHDLVWADELAAWRYEDAWDQAQFGLRLGDNPLCVVTTTPRPVKVIRDLLDDYQVLTTTGTTYENINNVAKRFLEKVKRKYEGTRLGQQELLAKILDDVPGALWTRAILDDGRVMKHPDLKRIVVAIDPAMTVSEESNETGIIVAGVDGSQVSNGYVLDDVTISGSPSQWAQQAISAYHKYDADLIIAETNNGGDMVEHTIKTEDRAVNFKQVRASRGKYTRAEPISALYEQGRVHHVGMFAELEDQLCTWVPGDVSPDRLDACVWALTELMLGGPATLEIHSENPFTRRRG